MSVEAKVGAFVIASLLVLGAAIYFVRTAQTVRGQIPYKTYLRYAGGLDPGAAVLFGGIKVGQVTAVEPSSEDPTRIEIRFQVKRGTPVNEKSTARVSSVSLMSSPILSITTGTNEARRLTEGEVVPSEESVQMEEIMQRVAAVAETADELIMELRKEIPVLTGQAQTLLANLNEISGPGNQKRIAQALAELDTIMSRESPKIAEITDKLSSLAAHADEVVLSVQPFIANLDQTVANANITIDQVRDPLKKDLEELQHTIRQARTLLASLENVVRTNDRDISEIVRNLRSASENLDSLTQTLTQRPWNLIRTTQPPERKVPQ